MTKSVVYSFYSQNLIEMACGTAEYHNMKFGVGVDYSLKALLMLAER
jgi:hypothetical protein